MISEGFSHLHDFGILGFWERSSHPFESGCLPWMSCILCHIPVVVPIPIPIPRAIPAPEQSQACSGGVEPQHPNSHPKTCLAPLAPGLCPLQSFTSLLPAPFPSGAGGIGANPTPNLRLRAGIRLRRGLAGSAIQRCRQEPGSRTNPVPP